MLNEQPKKGKTQHQRESFSKGKRENLGKRLGKTLITVIIIIIIIVHLYKRTHSIPARGASHGLKLRVSSLRFNLLRRMTKSASVINSGAHSFPIFLGSQKLPCFFNFPVSRARLAKMCDFYWLQLRITCKSGWIAQAEKKILAASKEGENKLRCSVEEDKDCKATL